MFCPKPEYLHKVNNLAITWYKTNTVGYLYENLVFQELYAYTF